ncbi:hypothetical protein FB45DRAFT_981820 [Roridomyces roridus]|uniref:Integrase core domain-containing protein n=1 Tax=Roridomyces roridus TaxID=1738132 RepID=A0AAD7FAY6_9AGAR|nr:hypothetical protein FB45DRAFT_981820 [Roridomyces roridus]
MEQFQQLGSFVQDALLNAFRTHYSRFQAAVTDLVQNRADAVVISRLGDDLDEFARILSENETVFHHVPDEFEVIQTSLVAMRHDIRLEYRDARSTAGISRFLGVSRTTVRNALLDLGVVEPQQSPFPLNGQITPSEPEAAPDDDILDPQLPIPDSLPPDVHELLDDHTGPTISSYTGPQSSISDDDLDTLLIRLRTHYRRAGLSMLNGMLRRLGHRVSTERVRQSLLRIDPVRRIFERIRIRRREYHVLGPNSLWHHDGQHGKSVHNVRIERLWVDVTAQVGATWADHFTLLELRYGLDINNVAHIWLLHFLFLGTINTQLAFFAESWNQHRIQMRHSTNRSPTDMFVFDMYANGVRGDRLPPEEEDLAIEELEVYGIDWQGLREDGVLHSQAQNNSVSEGSSSWVGNIGPPPDLSQVVVQPPPGFLTGDEAAHLYSSFAPLFGSADTNEIISLWTHALTYVRVLYPNEF